MSAGAAVFGHADRGSGRRVVIKPSGVITTPIQAAPEMVIVYLLASIAVVIQVRRSRRARLR